MSGEGGRSTIVLFFAQGNRPQFSGIIIQRTPFERHLIEGSVLTNLFKTILYPARDDRKVVHLFSTANKLGDIVRVNISNNNSKYSLEQTWGHCSSEYFGQ